MFCKLICGCGSPAENAQTEIQDAEIPYASDGIILRNVFLYVLGLIVSWEWLVSNPMASYKKKTKTSPPETYFYLFYIARCIILEKVSITLLLVGPVSSHLLLRGNGVAEISNTDIE